MMNTCAQGANTKAYENSGMEGGEYGPGGPVEACRRHTLGKEASNKQQHCVSPHLHIQAIIAATCISRISCISLLSARLREWVILTSAWEATHA